MAYNLNSITQVAKLYYYEHMLQRDIAEKLNITQVAVARMLKAARNKGIVRVFIADPTLNASPLKQALMAQYSLKNAVIAKLNTNNLQLKHINIAKASSTFLSRTLKNGDIVGLGWGEAVTNMVMQLSGAKPNAKLHKVTVVPVIGGIHENIVKYDVNELVRITAEILECSGKKLYAPAVVENQLVRDALMSDRSISQICDLWSNLNVLVIGIGNMVAPIPTTITRYLETKPIHYKKLDIKSDICGIHFNSKGVYVPTQINDSLIAINYDQLKQTPHVIAIACGDEKIQAMSSALKNGFIHTLISDEETVVKLLEYETLFT